MGWREVQQSDEQERWMRQSRALRRWLVTGFCLASATLLVVGLILIPALVRVKTLDCIEGEPCAPNLASSQLLQELPLPLGVMTLIALCWVVLGSLSIGAILVFSHVDTPRWLRLSYLAGGICLALMLTLDALYLLPGALVAIRPDVGALVALIGLCLLAVAQLFMRSTVADRQ
jgi:hypothetical protein